MLMNKKNLKSKGSFLRTMDTGCFIISLLIAIVILLALYFIIFEGYLFAFNW